MSVENETVDVEIFFFVFTFWEPMSSVKVELAVEMTCQSCVDIVSTSLRSQHEVQDFSIELGQQRVVVQTTGSIGNLAQQLEEQTKLRVRIRGISGSQGNLGAAVCMLQGLPPFEHIQGVVRAVQLTPTSTIFEAAVSGLPVEKIKRLSINIHQLGDISAGRSHVSPSFLPISHSSL